MSGESGIRRAINSTRYGNWLTTSVRIFLGAMLVFSGAVKIVEPDAFSRVIALYDIIPVSLVPYAALGVPALELLLGLMLCAGSKVRAASCLSALLMAAFVVFIAVNVVRGKQFNCGCFDANLFGLDLAERVSPWLVLRDLVFMAGFMLVFGAERHLGSLEHLMERTRLKNLEKSKYE
jgi:putative oxidoreductase